MVRCCAVTEMRRGATFEQPDALSEEEGRARVKCAQPVRRHGLGCEVPEDIWLRPDCVGLHPLLLRVAASAEQGYRVALVARRRRKVSNSAATKGQPPEESASATMVSSTPPEASSYHAWSSWKSYGGTVESSPAAATSLASCCCCERSEKSATSSGVRPVLTSWKRKILLALVYVRRRKEPGRCSLASTCGTYDIWIGLQQ